MEQFYEAIENKIKQAGYNEFVNGEEIYNEICDEIEEKENGGLGSLYLFVLFAAY